MRADRLLQLMQLLQSTHSITAQEIAARLGVAVRTVYRDMDAIQRIGVPVLATAGRNGGYSVLPGYRSVLSGFTPGEIGSLMATASGADLHELGMEDTLRAAIMKLKSYIRDEGSVAGVDGVRVFLDSTAWEPRDCSDVLPVLVDAINSHRAVELTLGALPHTPGLRTRAEPVGMVHKGAEWHLVCRGTPHRVIAVGSIREVSVTDARFAPDGDFNLRDFWRVWCTRAGHRRHRFTATLYVRRSSLEAVQAYLTDSDPQVLCNSAPPRADVGSRDEARITAGFSSFEEARARLLGLGSAARVTAPDALRLSIVDYATQCITVNERSGQ